MKFWIRQNMSAIMIRTIAILALSVFGIAIGIALALVVAQFMGQFCPADSACQSAFYVFLSGVALTQSVNLIVIFALWRRLRQRKRLK